MNPGLSWLLDVATSAKEGLVADNGIGADLPPIAACFDINNEPLGQAQVVVASISRYHQMERLTEVATLMRSGWSAHALALVLEGYICLDENVHHKEPLSVRFANGDQRVVECMSVVHATADGDCTVVSLPYKIGLGRVVQWMHDEQSVTKGSQFRGSYSFILSEIFEQTKFVANRDAVPAEVAIMGTASQIADLGFFVVCQMLDPGSLDWINGEGN